MNVWKLVSWILAAFVAGMLIGSAGTWFVVKPPPDTISLWMRGQGRKR